MSNSWATIKLGDAVDFQRGLTYSKSDEVPISSNVVLRANNINLVDHSLDFSDLKYINENFVVPETKKVKKGSLLICTASGSKSHLGKVALVDEDYGYAFGGFMGQLIPRKSIDPYFLFYVLTSEPYKKFIGAMSDGININNLKFDDLKPFSFVLPPLTEQQRLVAVLDEAFAGIAKASENAQKNLANARELFNNYLQSVFRNNSNGWEEKKLSDIAEYFNGLTYSPKDVSDKGTIVLRSSNIQNDELSFSDIVKVSCPVKGKIIVRDGDILMCSRNGSKRLVGKTARIQNLKEEMTFGTFMMIIRGQHNDYLEWFFKSDEFRSQISSGENTMINQITRYMLDDLIVSFPPLDEQKAIVERIIELSNRTKRLEAIYQQKLEHLAALKQSILQKAFAGELHTDKLAA